jgi:hypothetical protein
MNSEAQRPFLLFTKALLLAFMCAPVAFGQDPQVSQVTAPPPLKAISKDERTQIEQTRDAKGRIRLTIELAITHLGLAENHTAQTNYESASVEIGIYHALIKDALAFLAPLKRDSNKTRDLYKRLELALRADGPRLTAMRRVTPLEFAVWIKEAEDFARQGRTEALNSFFGHTVVRDPQTPDAEKRAEKTKDAPTSKSRTP